MLNVEPSNSVFLKTYNTEFDEIIIIITFTDQNGGRLLEIEDKINFINFVNFHWLLINRNDAIFYRIKNNKIC